MIFIHYLSGLQQTGQFFFVLSTSDLRKTGDTYTKMIDFPA